MLGSTNVGAHVLSTIPLLLSVAMSVTSAISFECRVFRSSVDATTPNGARVCDTGVRGPL